MGPSFLDKVLTLLETPPSQAVRRFRFSKIVFSAEDHLNGAVLVAARAPLVAFNLELAPPAPLERAGP